MVSGVRCELESTLAHGTTIPRLDNRVEDAVPESGGGRFQASVPYVGREQEGGMTSGSSIF